MKIIRLLYFSQHRLDDWYDSRESGLSEIQARSLTNNRRDAVTGVLVCDDRWFLQVLEGIETRVSATFERILRDQRHHGVSLVTMQAVTERRYRDHAMACIVRDRSNHDLFHHYGEADYFDPRQMRPDRLSDLIEAVVRRKPMLPPRTAAA